MVKQKVISSIEHMWRKLPRGQGLVETALLLPVILVLFSGVVEFGFLLNEYLTIQDAVRNAARYSSDGLYSARDTLHNCTTTRDFYRQTACLLNQELGRERPLIVMNDNGTPDIYEDDYLDPSRGDDIVVSAFGMLEGVGVSQRFPAEAGESGWSYAQDLPIYGMRNHTSRFTTADITSRWLAWESSAGITTPSTGLLIVELFYNYDQKLDLPWITAFVPDPVLFHIYAIMPLVSAEPTPTPRP